MGETSEVKATTVEITEQEVDDDKTLVNEPTKMRWEERIDTASRVRRQSPDGSPVQTEQLPNWLSGEGCRMRWQERVAAAVQTQYAKNATKTASAD